MLRPIGGSDGGGCGSDGCADAPPYCSCGAGDISGGCSFSFCPLVAHALDRVAGRCSHRLCSIRWIKLRTCLDRSAVTFVRGRRSIHLAVDIVVGVLICGCEIRGEV